MSKIKLTGSNSGYVEIDSAADAGNLTLSLPTSGTRLLSNTDNVFSGITTTGELDINGKIDVSTDIVGGRNLKVTGITTHTGTTILNDDVTLTGASYDVLWDKSDNQLEFGDNAKLSFGASSDLQLYHDGTYNRIAANGQIFLQNKAANETYFAGYENGRVELYWDNSIKLTTETSGVNITGVCTATSFSGSGEGLTRTTQLSHRNIIINGAMLVAQRGTSFTNIADVGVYGSVDRMQMVGANLDELAFAGKQTSDGPDGFSKCFEFDVTTPENALDANDLVYVRYKVEGQDLKPFFNANGTGKNFTLSFYVKAYQAGTYQFNIYKADGSRFISKTYTISSSGVWQRVVLNFTGDTNTSGMVQTTNSGFNLSWIFAAGSNYTSGSVQPTWGGWPGNAGFAAGQAVNVASSANNYFRITGIQLELGDTATPFEHRSFTEELSRCQRYFVRTNFTSHCTAYFGGTHLFRQIQFVCPTPMRAQPSFSVTGNEGATTKFTIKTWSSDQNMTATPNAVHLHHVDYVHGTNNGAVHTVGVGIDFSSGNSGIPPNGPGNHNAYPCRMYGANLDAEL